MVKCFGIEGAISIKYLNFAPKFIAVQKIVLSDILPEIFAGSSLQSDVWQTDVEFDKGSKYLVQADSGKGLPKIGRASCRERV